MGTLWAATISTGLTWYFSVSPPMVCSTRARSMASRAMISLACGSESSDCCSSDCTTKVSENSSCVFRPDSVVIG